MFVYLNLCMIFITFFSGYGHISPSTTRGRGFCIAYAIIGIPIIGVFLAGLGQKIHTPFKKFKNKVFWKKHKKIEKLLKSVLISLLGFCLLLFLPAIGFHRNEGWTFFEAFYYGVISLTTIGFGDFVAGNGQSFESHHNKMNTVAHSPIVNTNISLSYYLDRLGCTL